MGMLGSPSAASGSLPSQMSFDLPMANADAMLYAKKPNSWHPPVRTSSVRRIGSSANGSSSGTVLKCRYSELVGLNDL